MKHNVHNGQLLDRVLWRLLPDAFFHPILVHFVVAGASFSLELIQSLLHAAEDILTKGDLNGACQVLLICAALQYRLADHTTALQSVQRAWMLAESHGLSRVVCWAAWGASAVCAHQGQFQQAAEHLNYLQSQLSEQHDWILADVVDLVRQALLSQAASQSSTDAGFARAEPLDTTQLDVLDRLLHWGVPPVAVGATSSGPVRYDLTDRQLRPSSASSDSRLRSRWQALKRILKGELRLKWVEAKERPQYRIADQPTESPATSHPLARSPAPDLAPSVPSPSDRISTTAEPVGEPSLTAHLLGTFSFAVNDHLVETWPTGKGRSILKYLLAHHDQSIPRDVLMDVFWPNANPASARNSLNVALHGLRHALRGVANLPVVVFEEGAYRINPEIRVWVDVDEFDQHVRAGRRLEASGQTAGAAAEYEVAIGLYQGDFLASDLYEEWPVLPRERLRVACLDILDRLSRIYFNRQQYAACVTTCQQILSRDNCREDAHCLLMLCYSRQDQHHLALRQYQACVEALRTELEVAPAPATTQLYERIRRRERV